MTYQLYTKNEIKERPKRKHVTLESYIIGKNAPTVLVCPGGAYRMVSDFNEGKPFALELNKRGYNAFVLFYSIGAGNARYPYPLNDVARALQFIKSKAGELKINADSIALMGSSAGGHLAALFSAQYKRFETEYESEIYNLKPSALLLTYPVITMGELTHKESRTNLLGALSGKTERDAASVEKIVTADYPPAFMWHNKDDRSVDYRNSVMLKGALDRCGVKNELLLYETGGHGVGLAKGLDADGWIDKAIDFLDSVTEKQ
ncbi:MAG TPA: alpha/beta hydrolase [Ruminococcaceae bacterium]|nr:alpha/beta hydrolase [Oscillospiraceae bacterium]